MMPHLVRMPLRPGCAPACPACPHRQWSAEESLANKAAFLNRVLEPWKTVLKEMKSADESLRWGYRRQAVLHTRWDGQWQYGLLRRDELIPIPDCPVHHPGLNEALRILTNELPEIQSFPLVNIVASAAQITLVLKSKALPGSQWISSKLVSTLQQLGIEACWIHLHPSAGKKIFGKGGWHLIFGKAFSTDAQGLQYGPASFQQVLPGLYTQSLDKAESFLAPSHKSAIIDLYCGNGASMRRWAERGARVMGVEWSGEAVGFALENVPGAIVLRGLCRDRIPQLREWASLQKEEGKRLSLYVNPPRTGLETEITEWIIRDALPDRIAYLSCSAGSLRRDLDFLLAGGYSVKEIQPYDFFPQTRHVECLVSLERA